MYQNKKVVAAGVVAGIAVVYMLLRKILIPSYPVKSPGVIVVTGTSSGIGHEIAQLLAHNGYHVFAGVRRKESLEGWEDWKKQEGHPSNLIPIQLDVTEERHINHVYDAVQEYMKKHNVTFCGLVHNAGLGFHMPMEYHEMDNIRRMFDVNLFGPIGLTQRFLPLIREQQGRIVFISSLAGRITQPKEGVYSASKFSIEAIADALRQVLLHHKASVSCVEPGFVATPILKKILMSEDYGNNTDAATVYPNLYSNHYRKVFDRGVRTAGPPEQPARAVLAALTDKYPKTRYSVTNFMRVPTWLAIRAKWLVPDRIFDKFVAW